MAYIGKSPTGTGVRSRYYYTATGGETSLSGADDNSNTLVFSDGNYVDVSLNGIALVAGTDYNTSTANTISGLSALSSGDIVEVVVYDIFTVADTVSAKDGGTFSGNVAMGGTLSVTGASTLSSTLGVTGKITSTAGITFGSDTAAANVLDDYEEGTWTPVLVGGTTTTYTSQIGQYTKIGQLVHVYFDLHINAVGNGSTNTVGGLPFATINNDALAVSYWSGLVVSPYFISFQMGGSGALSVGTTSGTPNITNGIGIFGNSSRVIASGSYRTSA